MDTVKLGKLSKVAPYVGAWIETTIAAIAAQNPEGRTLRGCVD